MDVLREILQWSESRPDWQRDALRRLVLNSELEDTDIAALTEICKNAHGLAEDQEHKPLCKEHIPTIGTDDGQVIVQSIYHHCGVNALAADQTLNFGPGLTVVYGDNAAGKSGYTRIFKSACRARGSEDIIGNVLSGAVPPKVSVEIKYTVGTDGVKHIWTGDGEDDSLARVSVFDSHSATVYLREKTNVAFRPFGLDLFDKLSRACKAVREKLEQERRLLGSNSLQTIDLQEGTIVAKLVASLSSLTDPERVKSLATFSEEDKERYKLLAKQQVDEQANDPVKTARELSISAGRLRSFVTHMVQVDVALTEEAVKEVFEAQRTAKTKRDVAKNLRDTTFSAGLLAGTGSENWAEMWEAARQFSENNAYPNDVFPFTEEEARCVLCQQDLQADAVIRIEQFETFVVSVAETESREARDKYSDLYKGLDGLNVQTEATKEVVKEIRIEIESLADEVDLGLRAAEVRRAAVVDGLQLKQGMPGDLPGFTSIVEKVTKLAEQLDLRIVELQEQTGDDKKDKIGLELREFESRQRLGKIQNQVLAEIECKKKFAAYGLCINDTKTQGITAKSTAVTKVVVTRKLKKGFQDELKKLNFKHVEVELNAVGGDLGNLYHKLTLTRAPSVELPKVVSEGEARCLSIAAFFAEINTADDPSAILFDDPVSSLDYKWRRSVAKRLVEEAKTRQVIVFTHDIAFMLIMRQWAEDNKVDRMDQHVRQLAIGAGVCAEELPWVAMGLRKRIGFLKNEWQAADKLFRDGHQKTYEKEAVYIYGILREAWERGLEEVLLCGVVERHREGVQTQQIVKIADITEEDCQAVDAGMTKCSRWLSGHDQSAAAREDIPEPDELLVDIQVSLLNIRPN